MDDGIERIEHRRVEGQWLVLRLGGDEHARALARHHQLARLELVHRLAHHGARHAVRLGQLLLGGQAVTWAQGAGVDLVAHQHGQLVGQAPGHQGAGTCIGLAGRRRRGGQT